MKGFIDELPSRQQKDGHFGYDEIDWSKPIDVNGDKGRMMPLLWGNARFLCGLVRAYNNFQDPEILDCAKKLGDFYVQTADRFLDIKRLDEYNANGTYAAGFGTCYFPVMEGLIGLYRVAKNKKYLTLAERQAEFYQHFDVLPFDHSHGMLCNQFSLVCLYEITGTKSYLDRVEKRWNDLVDGGYIGAPGLIGERCRTIINRDEGCAMVDWLRLNLELAKVTGQEKYWDMAERIFTNHLIANLFENGGFGHRAVTKDESGTVGFGKYIEEATWCCDFHGGMAFDLLKPFVISHENGNVRIHFALDFTSPPIDSSIEWLKKPGKIMSQTISVKEHSVKKLLVRIPDWAESLTDASGNIYETENNYAVVPVQPDNKTEIVYCGNIIVENRRCRPVTKKVAEPLGDVVLRYGPKLLIYPDSMKKIRVQLPATLSDIVADDFTILCQPGPNSLVTKVKLKFLDWETRLKPLSYVFESVQ